MAKQPRTQILRGILVVIIFASLAVAAIFVDFAVLADRFRATGYEPSAEISQLAQNLKLTSKAEIIFAASWPVLEDEAAFNSSCRSTVVEISVLGCYTNQRIYIYNVENAELAGVKESTLAHELLHAAWERLGLTDQERLSPQLDAIYQENLDTLESRLDLYPDADFYNELHSIIGTEYANLPDQLETHYAQYFQNQDAVVVYFDAYNSKFQELKSAADALYAKIEQNQKLIDTKTANYNDAIAKLNAAISDFNNRANSGSFTSQAAFHAERAALVARQNQTEQLYREIDNLITTTNQLIDDYNSNIARSQTLSDSINSNAQDTEDIN